MSNAFNVQFLHRQLAYLLGTLAIFWFGAAWRHAAQNPGSLLGRVKWYPFLLVFLQIGLGIFTVLLAPKMGTSRFGSYELLAQVHQLVAMALLVALILNLYAVKRTA